MGSVIGYLQREIWVHDTMDSVIHDSVPPKNGFTIGHNLQRNKKIPLNNKSVKHTE